MLVRGRGCRSARWTTILLAGVMACGALGLEGTAMAGPFEEGLDFFQAGHYRWALEKFIVAVDRSPQDPQRLWYLAESYRQLGDNPAASQAYRQILRSAPQSSFAAAGRNALDSLGEPALTTVQIPFQKQGASVLLPASVNGQSVGYFILDTGATYTTISRQTASSLGITGSGSVTLSTASGVVQAPLAVLDQVEVGGASALHVPVVLHDLPNAPPAIVGLLGLSFLERFRINLDMTSGLLILESGK
ncbi:MAG TPA: aspartyl protease family protein [Candidatus Acidoferrum sp.]|nr:aspartyl protease family protein [Candidatus Acidoferrum sp.]